ncbi:hypothetical protein [Candidatus Phytoplasma fraxini]|uniref:Uncharacterized protein n=1 Tax=Ash yellows phytoplasma TaxID=35780 RepID=A0ABZ2U8C7_ASHYP
MLKFKFPYKFKYFFLSFFILLIFFFLTNHKVLISAQKNNESLTPQIHLVLLEQPYPLVDKEQLVNNYTTKYLNKTLQLNSSPCYNATSNNNLNTVIKDTPTNLLGVYFDGGIRENKENYYTLDNLKQMTNDVSNIYFFYDNTRYNDVTMQTRINKNFYFDKHKQHWKVPSEWRPCFWSYEKWRDYWYNKKTPTEKGYFLVKYGSQGFKIEVNIDEQETMVLIPAHAIGSVLENNFSQVKSLTENNLKTDLGDGIYIDYEQPLLTFKTNNWLDVVWNVSHNVINFIPYVGTAVDAVFGVLDIVESWVQDNPQQGINGVLDTAFAFLPIPGLQKLTGSNGIKFFSKKIPKLLQKEIIKQTTQNILEDIIKNSFKDGTKKIITQGYFTSESINIKLDDYTTLTTQPRNKLIYDIESNEKVHVINYLGEYDIESNEKVHVINYLYELIINE